MPAVATILFFVPGDLGKRRLRKLEWGKPSKTYRAEMTSFRAAAKRRENRS